MSFSEVLQKADVSRRHFLKGMAALGAAGAITGCGSSGEDTYITGEGREPLKNVVEPEDLSNLDMFDKFFVTCPHNCGPTTKCLSQIWVKNGKIRRVTSEDAEVGPNGVPYNKDINDARKFACAKGRAYRYRVEHNGRLKYPMKQTKKRGDLTGFVRISWEQAYDEVLRKYWAIYSKYGAAAIHSLAGYNPSAAISVVTTDGGTKGSGYSDHSFHQYNYGYNIAGVPGSASYSSLGVGSQAWHVYNKKIKNWVSFGTNSMTTNNTMSHVYLMANKKAAESADFKHYVISPELTDTGVLCATDWVQIRNQTDPALIAGMIYHMIVNTFNPDGTVTAKPMLDVDYLDTVLYGFFDSPEYQIKTATGGSNGYFAGTDTDRGSSVAHPYSDNTTYPVGSIIVGEWKIERGNFWVKTSTSGDSAAVGTVVKTLPANTTGYTLQYSRWQKVATPSVYAYTEPSRTINAVLPGRSYAAWIMGNDDRLTKAMYDDSRNTKGHNYTAKRYVSDGISKARAGLCSMPVKGVPAKDVANFDTATAYYTKKDYMTPKSPEWAEKICGTPAATIRELAELYANTDNHPILTEWTGGLQKSENGVFTLFAIQTLFAVTKSWGWNIGSTGGMYQTWQSALPSNMGSAVSNPSGLSISGAPSTGSTGSARPSPSSGNPSAITNLSCAEHPQGLLFAFKEQLEQNPDWTGYANPQWNGEDRYLYDAAGAKTQVLWQRGTNGTSTSTVSLPHKDGGTRSYTEWAKDNFGNPIYSGIRMYIGGNGVMMNGVQGVNWVAEILQCLPLAGDNPDDADTFCLAAFDYHLHTHVRFADYVFPMMSTLEAHGSETAGGRSFNRPRIVTPPGEAKDGWDAGFVGWKQRYVTLGRGTKTYSRIDGGNDFTLTTPDDAHWRYIGETTTQQYKSQAEKWEATQQAAIDATNPGHVMYNKTIQQVLELQIRGINQQDLSASVTEPSKTNALRTRLDTYLEGDMSAPYINTFSGTAGTAYFGPSVSNASATHTTGVTASAPGAPGRINCYVQYAVHTWENANDVHHGWLPAEKRGNNNKDYEDDPFVFPIPMYYDLRDCYNEMYGVFNPNPARRNLQVGWKLIGEKPATNDISLIKDRLTVTFGNTHDRFRSHSSTAENPLTRELNCRTKGGGWASGNDWKEYGVIPEPTENKVGIKAGIPAMRSAAIASRNMKTASWHECWMNDEDAAQYGIKDGDLIRVSNPVGAVRVAARVTARIVRGHIQIHHGAWYDPNPVDGVDDGACPGTLTSNRPSKLDNGNSLHNAYCVVEKETSF